MRSTLLNGIKLIKLQMQYSKYLKESKRLIKYILIGIFTTLLTWIIWNLLYSVLTTVNSDPNKKILLFSISQFLASFLIIYPSFWLNRRITFKDKTHRHSKKHLQILNIYLIYSLAPLLSSLIILIINYIFPNILNFQTIILFFNIEIGKLFLQFLGFGFAAVFNFSGQRLWLYK